MRLLHEARYTGRTVGVCGVEEDTMLDRHDPFGRAMGLRQMMDRLLEDAFVMPRGGHGDGQGWGGPALNVYEDADTLVVEAQLPGLKPENLDINVEQGVLTISGQTTAEEERK